MSFDFGKALQNLEIKFRGRAALMASILAVLAVMFWLVVRDYAAHPIFSQVISYVILGLIFLILIMAEFGKPRPEEVPEKSVLQVGRIGLFFAKGLSSHQELIQLVRQWSGIEKLPPPSSKVQGSATQEDNYQDMSAAEAEKFILDVEKGVEQAVAREAQRLFEQLQKELPAKPERPRLEGKGGAPTE